MNTVESGYSIYTTDFPAESTHVPDVVEPELKRR